MDASDTVPSRSARRPAARTEPLALVRLSRLVEPALGGGAVEHVGQQLVGSLVVGHQDDVRPFAAEGDGSAPFGPAPGAARRRWWPRSSACSGPWRSSTPSAGRLPGETWIVPVMRNGGIADLGADRSLLDAHLGARLGIGLGPRDHHQHLIQVDQALERRDRGVRVRVLADGRLRHGHVARAGLVDDVAHTAEARRGLAGDAIGYRCSRSTDTDRAADGANGSSGRSLMAAMLATGPNLPRLPDLLARPTARPLEGDVGKASGRSIRRLDLDEVGHLEAVCAQQPDPARRAAGGTRRPAPPATRCDASRTTAAAAGRSPAHPSSSRHGQHEDQAVGEEDELAARPQQAGCLRHPAVRIGPDARRRTR